MPFFSIIIPTYNRAIYLQQAINSVLSQTYTDYELIVVDDGSIDETSLVVKEYGDRIRYLYQKNNGPGSARNLGIYNAKGYYIGFLDSDDYWYPWMLEVVKNSIDKYQNPSMIVMKSVDFTDSAELLDKVREPLKDILFKDYIASAQRSNVNLLTCSSVVLNSVELRRVGGFTCENINAEDSDLWLRLGNSKNYIEIQLPVCCGYRRHSNSAVGNLDKTYLGMIKVINNEINNVYPGGRTRSIERRRIITRHVRPVTLTLYMNGERYKSMYLYLLTLRWNIFVGRWKYLIGYWVLIIKISIIGNKCKK